MKILYTIVLSAMFLSCKGRVHKYVIEGMVRTPVERPLGLDEVNVTEELRPARAYTDTIHGMNEDSVWYYNTDGSKLTIMKPYKVYVVE